MSAPWIAGIAGTLARASLEGGLFVVLVWTVCRLFPRLPAAVRCGLWWAACLKLLLGLAALPAVRLPLLPAVERAAGGWDCIYKEGSPFPNPHPWPLSLPLAPSLPGRGQQDRAPGRRCPVSGGPVDSGASDLLWEGGPSAPGDAADRPFGGAGGGGVGARGVRGDL